MEKNNEVIGVEIKATKKPDNRDFQGLKYLQKYQQNSSRILLHAGSRNELLMDGTGVLP